MEGVKASRSSLYQVYEEWAKKAGEYVLSGKAFTSRMRSHGFDDTGWITEHGKSHRVRAWSGVALAGPAEEVPGQWD
jgi:phage/plasmid-associated DNA primase